MHAPGYEVVIGERHVARADFAPVHSRASLLANREDGVDTLDSIAYVLNSKSQQWIVRNPAFDLRENFVLIWSQGPSIGLWKLEDVVGKGAETNMAIVLDESPVNFLPRVAHEAVFQLQELCFQVVRSVKVDDGG